MELALMLLMWLLLWYRGMVPLLSTQDFASLPHDRFHPYTTRSSYNLATTGTFFPNQGTTGGNYAHLVKLGEVAFLIRRGNHAHLVTYGVAIVVEFKSGDHRAHILERQT
jgi:hypothetical protein